MWGFFQMLKELKGQFQHHVGEKVGSETAASTFYIEPPGQDEGGENKEKQNYEEPFDTLQPEVKVGDEEEESVPGTRASRTSNESFSEIFARHLKSRGSGSQSSRSNNRGVNKKVRIYLFWLKFGYFYNEL